MFAFDDADTPEPGHGYSYLVTAEDLEREGTLGLGTTAERSNFAPCP